MDRHRSASLLIIVCNYVIKVVQFQEIMRSMQMHKILLRDDVLRNLNHELWNA